MPSHATVRKATVWISNRCQCIYSNLALEDWIFRHHSFTNQDGMMIWRNRPAVVVGRHQNPWVELNVRFAEKYGINVARRQSGGGTVYHDLGNINICVFTNRHRHKRDENMRLVGKVLKERWNIETEVTKRHDLMMDGRYKISGTAAKLVYDKAYHHFTLMLDVDVEKLWSVLSSSLPGIHSKATASTRSEVKTLATIDKNIRYENVVQAIVDEFQSRYETTDVVHVHSITDEQFQSVESTLKEFTSWQLIYGTTPPFTVSSAFGNGEITLIMRVEKGMVSKFTIERKDNSGMAVNSDLVEILNASTFVGCRFRPELWEGVVEWMERIGL